MLPINNAEVNKELKFSMHIVRSYVSETRNAGKSNQRNYAKIWKSRNIFMNNQWVTEKMEEDISFYYQKIMHIPHIRMY